MPARVVLRAARGLGTWRRTLAKDAVTVAATFFRRPGPGERRALEEAAERYGRFLGRRAAVASR